mgnify:CR=1 FL=1
MSNKIMDRILLGAAFFLVCVFVVTAVAVELEIKQKELEIKQKEALHNECLADPKYDKFQCYSMIYGGK